MCMPNHVHGYVMLRDDAGRGGSVPSKILTPSKANSGEWCVPDSAQTRPYGSGEIVTPSKAQSGEWYAPDSAQTRPYEATRPGRAAEQRDQREKEGGRCARTGGSVPCEIVMLYKVHSGEWCAPDSAQTRPY